MKLGYARISTGDQNAAMQVEALVAAGVAEDKIFVDEMSGAKIGPGTSADGQASRLRPRR